MTSVTLGSPEINIMRISTGWLLVGHVTKERLQTKATVSQPHLGFQKFDIDILHHESLGGSIISDNFILSLMLQKSKYLQVTGPEI